MWDTWELSILSGIAAVCGLLSLLWLAVEYVKRRRQIKRRLYKYVQRRKAKKWTCRKCGYHGVGPAPMGPVCRGCWLALDEYLSEVA